MVFIVIHFSKLTSGEEFLKKNLERKVSALFFGSERERERKRTIFFLNASAERERNFAADNEHERECKISERVQVWHKDIQWMV